MLFGRGRVFCFFAVWAGGVFVFAVWAGVACFFFAVWAVAFFFCCLGGGVFFFLLFGPGACFFFAVWAGNGSSLTYPSAWLVFKRPNNKRDRTAKKKKKHGFRPKPPTSETRACRNAFMATCKRKSTSEAHVAIWGFVKKLRVSLVPIIGTHKSHKDYYACIWAPPLS